MHSADSDKKADSIIPVLHRVVDSIADISELFSIDGTWHETHNGFANQAMHPDDGDAVLSAEDIISIAAKKYGIHPDEIVTPKDPHVDACFSAQRNIHEAIRAGKLYVNESYLDKPNTIISTTQVTEDMLPPAVVLPTINGDGSIVNQGRDPSSFLPYLLGQSKKDSQLLSNASISSGGDAFHTHAAPFTCSQGIGGNYTLTLRTIMTTAISPGFEPNKSPSNWAEFTDWWINPVLRAARWAQGGSSLWAAGQNFTQIPSMPRRLSKCYIASHYKLERLPRWFVITQRLGWPRWINRFHSYFVYRFGDTIAGYTGWFNRLFMSYTLVPGMFLHPVYAIVNPHYYDKTMSYPDPVAAAAAVVPRSLSWVLHYANNVANIVVRYGQLLMQIIRDKLIFIAGGPPSKDDHITEESEYLYLNTSILQSLSGHISKEDRVHYHWPLPPVGPGLCPEWKGDATLMVCKNDDITANHWDSFDEGINGLAQIIKTKYPQPPFATFHVIYGKKKETIFSGAEFILYWNFYRPLVRPLLYRIEIREGDDAKQPKMKKEKGMPKEERKREEDSSSEQPEKKRKGKPKEDEMY